MEYIIKTLIASLFGTLGFGMLFKVKPQLLTTSTIGGVLTWSIVLISEHFGAGTFTSNIFASIFAIIFSSIIAIKLKSPATVLLTPCLIPLVPGGSLYYTMQSLISKDYSSFYAHGSKTILTAVGIAGGIVIGSIIFSAIYKPIPKFKNTNKFKSEQ